MSTAATPKLSELARAAPPYLDGLNPEQRKAVETLDGPVLMLAGAGTGKTRALTTRLAHILATQRAYPSQILAVTFTNKAAREMRERVGALIGAGVEGLPWLGTFHSVGAQILRKRAELVGLESNFTILDTDDQLRLMKQIVQAEELDEKRWTARHLASLIDRWKNRAWTPDDVPEGESYAFADGKGAHLYRIYQQRLSTLNCVDFGDLLLLNVRVLRENPDVLDEYHRKFRYILVDEYQDTNTAQYLWLRLLAQGSNNICVVGDDDQSIYGWRGAEVDNILRFEKDFPGATVIRLERNYRSTGHILGAASGLIATNKTRLGKTLWTDGEEGEKVEVRGVWDGEEEARAVASAIENWNSKGRKLTDVAVLVRASWQMRAFEERFLQMGIPHKVVGGPRFYERQEIRDAHAYLRLVRAPDDDLAFERIVNTPKRGVGDTSVRKIAEAARRANMSLSAAAGLLLETDEIKGPARAGLKSLLADLENWRGAAATMRHDELAEKVLDESGYSAMWKADKSAQAQGRLENLKELIRAMGEYGSLEAYLEHVALVTELDQVTSDDEVWLMTLHAAKGLEFPLVFLPGWEETVFPSQRSLDENGAAGLEEERRLAYVGLTRARERAVILFAANRQIYGRWQSVLPSRFVDELPSEHATVASATGYGASAEPTFAAVTEAGDPFRSTYESPGWKRFQAAQAKGLRTPPVIEGDGRVIASENQDARVTVGARVFHQKFGYGQVLQVDGAKLIVDFEHTGRKKVLDSFVETH